MFSLPWESAILLRSFCPSILQASLTDAGAPTEFLSTNVRAEQHLRATSPFRTFRRRLSHDAGFTIIELIGVIAVVAVLTGLLLPAVQTVREAASRGSAVSMLQSLCLAALAFDRTMGRLPETLLELTGPEHPVSDGAHDGRRYAVRTVPGWSIVADPLPGVTGHDSAVVHATDCQLRFYPTPGAAEGRQRMLEGLTIAAARAIANIVALALPGDGRVLIAEVRSYAARSDARRNAEDALGDAGVISLMSVDNALSCDGSVHPFACDGSVRPIVHRLRDDIRRALQLGVHDEDWGRVPGVQSDVLTGEDLFTVETLATLTTAVLHERTLEARLLAALQNAERAESSGNEPRRVAAIERFLEGIRDGTSITDGTSLIGGTSRSGERSRLGPISVTDALTLEVLARIWLGGADSQR
jgi:type II secretory pathway pseudopilin PulG